MRLRPRAIPSCATPPGPGEVACPPGSEQYFLAVFGGVLGAISAEEFARRTDELPRAT